MGCCMSHVDPPVSEYRMNYITDSQTTSTTKSAETKQFRTKQEPQMSYNSTDEDNKPDDKQSDDPSASSIDDEVPPISTPQFQSHQLSDFQMKIEERKSELLREKQKLKELQRDAFEQQVQAQQLQGFKRLYDIWQEFAMNDDPSKMCINGLTKALAVFGMIIDTTRHFQKHIFRKFDLDNEKVITYADFSATIASFVGSNTDDDSLQTLFEIFDIDEDGYLELQDMARILLAQNHIAVVVTGKQDECTIVYTQSQCLKQAKRMVSKYDSDQFNDDKISFDEFKAMMQNRTENDMIINHMQAPSLSINDDVYHLNHNKRSSLCSKCNNS